MAKNKAKNIDPKPLSNIEWTTCWMAIRYAMHRQTIASATLPADIINAYWNRLSINQKKIIALDLKREDENYPFEGKAFGSESIDRPIWIKFYKAMDIDNHYEVELIDDSIHTVFEANGRIYPLQHYVDRPHAEVFCENETIKRKISKEENNN